MFPPISFGSKSSLSNKRGCHLRVRQLISDCGLGEPDPLAPITAAGAREDDGNKETLWWQFRGDHLKPQPIKVTAIRCGHGNSVGRRGGEDIGLPPRSSCSGMAVEMSVPRAANRGCAPTRARERLPAQPVTGPPHAGAHPTGGESPRREHSPRRFPACRTCSYTGICVPAAYVLPVKGLVTVTGRMPWRCKGVGIVRNVGILRT